MNLYIKILRACPEVILMDARRCPEVPGGARRCPEEYWTSSGHFTSGHPPGILRASSGHLRASSGHLQASSGHFLRAFPPGISSRHFFYLCQFLPESVFYLSHYLPESFSSRHFLRAFPPGISNFSLYLNSCLQICGQG